MTTKPIRAESRVEMPLADRSVQSLRSRSWEPPHRRGMSCCRLAILCIACTVAGCGTQTYENRLKETADYFRYLAEVNEALVSTPWREAGITLRVPKQFELIPPPAPDDESAEEAESNGDGPTYADGFQVPPDQDPRQPEFFDKPLPGLVGAWRASVSTDTGSGVEERDAYLYVLSNYYMWLDDRAGEDDGAEPQAFHEHVANRLADQLGEPPDTPTNPWPWEDQRIAQGAESYVPQKLFTTIRLQEEIDGMLTDFVVYKYEQGDIRVVLLFAMPAEQLIVRSDPLWDAIYLSLEQLTVDGQIPRQRPEGEAAPAPSGF